MCWLLSNYFHSNWFLTFYKIIITIGSNIPMGHNILFSHGYVFGLNTIIGVLHKYHVNNIVYKFVSYYL